MFSRCLVVLLVVSWSACFASPVLCQAVEPFSKGNVIWRPNDSSEIYQEADEPQDSLPVREDLINGAGIHFGWPRLPDVHADQQPIREDLASGASTMTGDASIMLQQSSLANSGDDSELREALTRSLADLEGLTAEYKRLKSLNKWLLWTNVASLALFVLEAFVLAASIRIQRRRGTTYVETVN